MSNPKESLDSINEGKTLRLGNRVATAIVGLMVVGFICLLFWISSLDDAQEAVDAEPAVSSNVTITKHVPTSKASARMPKPSERLRKKAPRGRKSSRQEQLGANTCKLFDAKPGKGSSPTPLPEGVIIE